MKYRHSAYIALLLVATLVSGLLAGCADNRQDKASLRSELTEYKQQMMTEPPSEPAATDTDPAFDIRLDEKFVIHDLTCYVPGDWHHESGAGGESWLLVDDGDVIRGVMQLISEDYADYAKDYRQMHAELDTNYDLLAEAVLEGVGIDPGDPSVRYEDRRVLELPARAIYSTLIDQNGEENCNVYLLFAHSQYIYAFNLAMPIAYEDEVKEALLDFIIGMEREDVNFRHVPWPDTARITVSEYDSNA